MMIQKLETWIAGIALNKWLPTRWAVDLWANSSGWRTYICLGLWVAVYIGHRAHFGFLADDALANGLLNGLEGTGIATMLEKFKRYLPEVDVAVDSIAEKMKADTDPKH